MSIDDKINSLEHLLSEFMNTQHIMLIKKTSIDVTIITYELQGKQFDVNSDKFIEEYKKNYLGMLASMYTQIVKDFIDSVRHKELARIYRYDPPKYNDLKEKIKRKLKRDGTL